MTAPAATTGAADLVRRILGDDGLADEPARWATRDLVPGAVALPRSEEEAAEVLREATRAGLPTLPAGSGSWLGGGDPPGPVALVVSTRRMDRILQYEPADLTLTAGAGIGLEALAAATGEHDQWLPLDPPGAPEGSLGATIATGSEGFLSTRYGSVRDLVLGMTLVTGDGRVLRLGGRVVKNVAGFDLVRLVAGSHGTLGLVTAATVRLHPRPPAIAHLRARADSMEELVPAARTAAGGSVVPARLELREVPGEARRREATLAVTFHGHEASVDAEAERLSGEIKELEREDEDFAVPEPARDPDLVVRLRLPRSELAALVDVARELGRLDGGRNVLRDAPVVYRADPLRGIVRIVVPNVRTDEAWGERWGVRLEDLRQTMTVRGGGLTVESGPRSIVGGVGAWRRPAGGEATLMRRLRDRFDPERILAPERHDF